MIDIYKLARESGASFERMSQQYSTVDWWQFCPNELQLYTEKVILAAQKAERERIIRIIHDTTKGFGNHDLLVERINR